MKQVVFTKEPIVKLYNETDLPEQVEIEGKQYMTEQANYDYIKKEARKEIKNLVSFYNDEIKYNLDRLNDSRKQNIKLMIFIFAETIFFVILIFNFIQI